MRPQAAPGKRPTRLRSDLVRGRIFAANDITALPRIDETRVSAVLVRRRLSPKLKMLADVLPDIGFCRMVPLDGSFTPSALLGRSFPREVAAVLADDIERVQVSLAGPLRGRGHAQL